MFTINLSQSQIKDYTRSIKAEINNGEIAVHKTRISNTTNSNRVEFYNQIAYFFISEFENLSNHQKQIYKPNKLDFDNPFDGAAKILFSDVANGLYFIYVNNLEEDLTHKRVTLLTHNELTQMIKQLKIHDLFNQ